MTYKFDFLVAPYSGSVTKEYTEHEAGASILTDFAAWSAAIFRARRTSLPAFRAPFGIAGPRGTFYCLLWPGKLHLPDGRRSAAARTSGEKRE
jgi:hypothetical protein